MDAPTLLRFPLRQFVIALASRMSPEGSRTVRKEPPTFISHTNPALLLRNTNYTSHHRHIKVKVLNVCRRSNKDSILKKGVEAAVHHEQMYQSRACPRKPENDATKQPKCGKTLSGLVPSKTCLPRSLPETDEHTPLCKTRADNRYRSCRATRTRRHGQKKARSANQAHNTYEKQETHNNDATREGQTVVAFRTRENNSGPLAKYRGC